MTVLSSPSTSTVSSGPGHEHGWDVESRHAVSTGIVLYVRCGGCGARRVDEQARPPDVPTARSRLVAAAGSAQPLR